MPPLSAAAVAPMTITFDSAHSKKEQEILHAYFSSLPVESVGPVLHPGKIYSVKISETESIEFQVERTVYAFAAGLQEDKRWELEVRQTLLGSGTFGAVYSTKSFVLNPEALQVIDSAVRVVKVMQCDAHSVELTEAIAAREVSLLADSAQKLFEPVGPIAAVSAEVGQLMICIRMNRVLGETLAKILELDEKGIRCLTLKDRVELVWQILLAYDRQCHEKMAHLDIKPGNMMCRFEPSIEAQFIDIASAVRVEESLRELRGRFKNYAEGTPGYAADEVVHGRIDEIGPLADMRSLECVFETILGSTKRSMSSIALLSIPALAALCGDYELDLFTRDPLMFSELLPQEAAEIRAWLSGVAKADCRGRMNFQEFKQAFLELGVAKRFGICAAAPKSQECEDTRSAVSSPFRMESPGVVESPVPFASPAAARPGIAGLLRMFSPVTRGAPAEVSHKAEMLAEVSSIDWESILAETRDPSVAEASFS